MERFKERSFTLFEKIVSSGYNYEVQNKENLGIMKKKPDNPCVVYFNHTAMDDPFVVVDLLHKEVPDRFDNVVIPVSEYYANFKNHFSYAFFVKSGRALGLSMPEVVQSYRRRNKPESTKLQEKSQLLNINFTNLLAKELSGGSVIVVAPEGHRSDDGKLQPAEAGIGFMARIMEKRLSEGKIENGYFIPVGITYEKRGDGLHYNPFNKESVKISIGEPEEVRTVIAEARSLNQKSGFTKITSHVLMHKLSKLLPPEHRGVYGDNNYPDTLDGRYESRMNEKGKVYVFDSKKEDN